MEMVVATKVTYKYLMNQSKHDLAQMVLDLLKKKERLSNERKRNQTEVSRLSC